MELSMRWAERSRRRSKMPRLAQAFFGIVQGGVSSGPPRAERRRLCRIGFDGYAIGGLAIGEGRRAMLGSSTVPLRALPADRPRYLMGVGTPGGSARRDPRGIDMFDCVMPTRSAPQRRPSPAAARLNLRNARYADDDRPARPGVHAARRRRLLAAPICII